MGVIEVTALKVGFGARLEMHSVLLSTGPSIVWPTLVLYADNPSFRCGRPNGGYLHLAIKTMRRSARRAKYRPLPRLQPSAPHCAGRLESNTVDFNPSGGKARSVTGQISAGCNA